MSEGYGPAAIVLLGVQREFSEGGITSRDFRSLLGKVMSEFDADGRDAMLFFLLGLTNKFIDEIADVDGRTREDVLQSLALELQQQEIDDQD